jgi:hypothetical protein
MSKDRPGFEIASTAFAPMLADPRSGTATWRTAAAALSEGAEAEDAWRLLAPTSSAEALALLSVVVAALDATLREVRRPPADSERRDIEGVIKKSRALQLAIRTSSLPGGVNYGPYELQPAADLPAVMVDFGWHSTSPEHSLAGYCVSVDEVLEWAIEKAQKHLDSLPPRAGSRQRGGLSRAAVKVFVRYLALHFGKRFDGDERRGAIAHIATALFKAAEPLDHASVEAMLKDRPEQFDSRPKARGKRSKQGDG